MDDEKTLVNDEQTDIDRLVNRIYEDSITGQAFTDGTFAKYLFVRIQNDIAKLHKQLDKQA